ncbi:MAG: hypothetical protein ABI440_03645 [Casimicrobiaceae bacterium]
MAAKYFYTECHLAQIADFSGAQLGDEMAQESLLLRRMAKNTARADGVDLPFQRGVNIYCRRGHVRIHGH